MERYILPDVERPAVLAADAGQPHRCYPPGCDRQRSTATVDRTDQGNASRRATARELPRVCSSSAGGRFDERQ